MADGADTGGGVRLPPAEAKNSSEFRDDAGSSAKPSLGKRKAGSLIERAMEPLSDEERESWKGWIELESEPVVFNHVLRSYGVKDVKIEEVLQLDMLLSLESVHGLIFLFRFQDSDAEEDVHTPQCPKNVWFANQITDNACATIALLNIVMNTTGLDLGEALTDFKGSTRKLKPAYRGLRLSQNDSIRKIHNSFVRRMDILNADQALQDEYERFVKKRKVSTSKKPGSVPKTSKTNKYSKTQTRPMDTSKAPQKKEQDDGESGYHFIAYVPVDGCVWRLDGLRRQPVNIGHCGVNWTTVAHQNIIQRVAQANSIDYSLLSLAPCPLVKIRHEIAQTVKSIESLEGALDMMVPDWKVFTPIDFCNYRADLEDSFKVAQGLIKTAVISDETSKSLVKGDPTQLLDLRTLLETQLANLKAAYVSELADIEEENEKAERRKHDHSQQVYHSIKAMSETGALRDIILGLH